MKYYGAIKDDVVGKYVMSGQDRSLSKESRWQNSVFNYNFI